MTLHAYVPVHQFKILLDDVEAKTHAIKIASVRFLDLLKGTEDSIHILRFDADARIGDGKFNAGEVAEVSHSQADLPLRREFKGIADKIL